MRALFPFHSSRLVTQIRIDYGVLGNHRMVRNTHAGPDDNAFTQLDVGADHGFITNPDILAQPGIRPNVNSGTHPTPLSINAPSLT